MSCADAGPITRPFLKWPAFMLKLQMSGCLSIYGMPCSVPGLKPAQWWISGVFLSAGNSFKANSDSRSRASVVVLLLKSSCSTVLPARIFPSRRGIRYWSPSSTIVRNVSGLASNINICPLTGATFGALPVSSGNSFWNNWPVHAPAEIISWLTVSLPVVVLMLVIRFCSRVMFVNSQCSINVTPLLMRSCFNDLTSRGLRAWAIPDNQSGLSGVVSRLLKKSAPGRWNAMWLVLHQLIAAVISGFLVISKPQGVHSGPNGFRQSVARLKRDTRTGFVWPGE